MSCSFHTQRDLTTIEWKCDGRREVVPSRGYATVKEGFTVITRLQPRNGR